MVDLGGFQMASTGWANITPWHTYREEQEDALYERIMRAASQITADPERLILNLHCPPYGSGIDDAPGVNEDMTPKHGGHAPEPVGSTAVRRAIEELSAGAVAAWPHSRGARAHPHRPHALDQPRQLL